MEESQEQNDHLPLKSSSTMSEQSSETKPPTTNDLISVSSESSSDIINHEIIETVDKEFQKLVLQEIEIENLEEEEEDGDDEIQVENEKVDGWSLDEVNQEEWTSIETSAVENGENGENQVVKSGKLRKSQYPNRPGEPDCSFYLKTGSCGFGSNCKFNHPPKKKQHKVRSLSNESQDSAAQVAEEKVENPKRVGHLECKYYLTPGGCKFGKVCRYHHPREKNASSSPAPPVSEFNFLGLPIRPGQRECPFYMRTGSCKFATNCRFNHPDPTAGGLEPVYDRSNSAPSSDPQSAISSWPSTDTIPYPNSTQTYMPNMHQPQGMHSSMEWNGYQAPMNPLYPPQGNVRPSMGPSPTGPVDEYPERPGQKECQFYLKTGDCKYKSSCRFHHPKPQGQAQVQAHFQAPAPVPPSLSPMGLPLRPDQIICTHFSRFGICKYGASCKYDHTPNPNSGSHSVAAGTGPLPYYHNPVPFVRGPMGNGGDGNTGYVQQPV